MAFNTNSNNPIWLSVIWMVILFSEFPAISTSQQFYWRDFTGSNGVAYNTTSNSPQRIEFPVFSSRFSMESFTFFALIVFFNGFGVYGSAFSSLGVFLSSYTATLFAISVQAVSTIFLFVKLREGFNLLALRTNFCLNVLRHSFSFTKAMLRFGVLSPRTSSLIYCRAGGELCQG